MDNNNLKAEFFHRSNELYTRGTSNPTEYRKGSRTRALVWEEYLVIYKLCASNLKQ